jgi:hypothetical protein
LFCVSGPMVRCLFSLLSFLPSRPSPSLPGPCPFLSSSSPSSRLLGMPNLLSRPLRRSLLPLSFPPSSPPKQTNQLAVRCHLTQPPHSIVLDSRSHIHTSEAGGVAFHSSATAYPVYAQSWDNGGHHMSEEEVLEMVVREDGDLHGAPTRLVCVENTLSGSAFFLLILHLLPFLFTSDPPLPSLRSQ